MKPLSGGSSFELLDKLKIFSYLGKPPHSIDWAIWVSTWSIVAGISLFLVWSYLFLFLCSRAVLKLWFLLLISRSLKTGQYGKSSGLKWWDSNQLNATSRYVPNSFIGLSTPFLTAYSIILTLSPKVTSKPPSFNSLASYFFFRSRSLWSLVPCSCISIDSCLESA